MSTLRLLLIAALAGGAFAAAPSAQGATTADVQTAFLLSFARFTEWPDNRRTGPVVVCIAGDDKLADALTQAVRTQNINGRPLQIGRVRPAGVITGCHVLFISKAADDTAAALIAEARTLPVLTVSDREGFAKDGGIIEFMLDNARMRFAVNVRSAQRAGLNLSSRVLGLAKAVYATSSS